MFTTFRYFKYLVLLLLINSMVKNFIHILRTYFITFRYIKKNEIFLSQTFALFIIFVSTYSYFISFAVTLI